MPSGPCVTIDPVTGAETASDWGYKQESYQFYLPEPESEDAVGPLKTIQRITNLDSGQQVVRTTLGYNLDGKKAYKSRYINGVIENIVYFYGIYKEKKEVNYPWGKIEYFYDYLTTGPRLRKMIITSYLLSGQQKKETVNYEYDSDEDATSAFVANDDMINPHSVNDNVISAYDAVGNKAEFEFEPVSLSLTDPDGTAYTVNYDQMVSARFGTYRSNPNYDSFGDVQAFQTSIDLASIANINTIDCNYYFIEDNFNMYIYDANGYLIDIKRKFDNQELNIENWPDGRPKKADAVDSNGNVWASEEYLDAPDDDTIVKFVLSLNGQVDYSSGVNCPWAGGGYACHPTSGVCYVDSVTGAVTGLVTDENNESEVDGIYANKINYINYISGIINKAFSRIWNAVLILIGRDKIGLSLSPEETVIEYYLTMPGDLSSAVTLPELVELQEIQEADLEGRINWSNIYFDQNETQGNETIDNNGQPSGGSGYRRKNIIADNETMYNLLNASDINRNQIKSDEPKTPNNIERAFNELTKKDNKYGNAVSLVIYMLVLIFAGVFVVLIVLIKNYIKNRKKG